MATETSVGIDPVADQAREELAQLEIEIDNVEKELVKQQNKLLKPIWEKRKAILTKIKDFWPVAVGNHPILSNLMNYEDSEVYFFLFTFTSSAPLQFSPFVNWLTLQP